MDEKKVLQKAKKLDKEINELEYFLHTVTRYNDSISGITSVKVFMKQSIVKKVSFFGSRFFGCGTHEQEIQVPNRLRNDLIDLAYKRLSELESEYKSLLTPKKPSDG